MRNEKREYEQGKVTFCLLSSPHAWPITTWSGWEREGLVVLEIKKKNPKWHSTPKSNVGKPFNYPPRSSDGALIQLSCRCSKLSFSFCAIYNCCIWNILPANTKIWNTRDGVSFLTNKKAAFERQWKSPTTNTAGISGWEVRQQAGGSARGNTGIHKSHRYWCIYFQTSFHCAGASSVPSVPSGAALGSRKSGCWSSFRYLGGVRMWVEPTRDKGLEGQHGLNSGWKLIYDIRYTLEWSQKKNIQGL